MGLKKLAKQVLSEKENIRYRSLLAKRRVDYGEWLERQKLLWQAENEEKVPGEADDSEIVFICASRGVMTAYARKSIICYFNKHPEVQLLYGDEDVQGTGEEACFPVFKPDWSPDVLDGCFYFGSLVAMRKELFTKAAEAFGTAPFLQTAKKNDYLVTDFSEYVSWMYRCVSMTDGYERSSRNIGHIAQILFHCESLAEQIRYREETACMKERSRALLTAMRDDCRVRQGTADPLVSIVIPSKDHPRLLENCLKAVKNTADGLKLEIIVVDNGSSQENREETEKLIRDLTTEYMEMIYLYQKMEFNFSRMCNLGAEKAKGSFLLFLNDDVELAVQGCIGQMTALAARSYTGAVGLKLYYPETKKIQHAGITNLPMGPVHKLQFQEDNGVFEYAYEGNGNYLAVTAACLMTERKKFQEAGGFAEELQVAFNDVDLCFRLYELGYQNVCMNGSYAYHHESLSRGGDESIEKLERLLTEREKLYARHPELEGVDPYYSIYLNREGLDTNIRPVYETAGNSVQEHSRFLAEKTLYDYRRDECVMVRIEAVRAGEILGWSTILGDNNACYEKELILKRVSETFSAEADEWFRAPAGVYGILLEGQYRPDLQENMPDQVNVALNGFHIRLKVNLLPPGRYRIGIAVHHRITGLKLMNWSNRFAEI